MAQFYKACLHINLLSTEINFVIQTDYQPKLHLVYIVVTGATLNFCLAKKLIKQYFFLLNSCLKLGPSDMALSFKPSFF